MAMPTGDTPQKAQDYYHYLLSRHETEHRVETWHVNWFALSWFWGFVAALALILIFWIWQYRTTRQKTGIYPIDSWSGYTSELAGPASLFFLLFCAILTGFAVAIIVGHIVNGQTF
jgi:hypothetical protein